METQTNLISNEDTNQEKYRESMLIWSHNYDK